MKISYAVKNLRSLQEKTRVELRPITILVGRNGAGKSTYLRSLPLLRQSIQDRSSAPILWFGQYVDFGNYNSAVAEGDPEKEITFEFVCQDIEIESFFTHYWSFQNRHRLDRYGDLGNAKQKYSKIIYRIELGQDDNRTVRRRMELEIPEHKISLVSSFEKNCELEDCTFVNGCNVSEMLPNHALDLNENNIFSDFLLFRPIRDKSAPGSAISNPFNAFSSYISRIVTPKVDGRVGKKRINAESRKMLKYPRLQQKELNDLSKNSGIKSIRDFYNTLKSDQEIHSKINAACAMNYCMQVMSDISFFLHDLFSNVIYLGPARARSERYYRFQELEISEIDSDGHNLPMLLNSLSKDKRSGFSNWIKDLFGFGIDIEESEGHISILLDKGEFKVNMADTGYGFSQLLPVLAQIWWSSIAFPNLRGDSVDSDSRLIVMEQPELHLHPAHQALIADTLINALEKRGQDSVSNPLFIVETHSESLINRLGELIGEGKLSQNDVQIVIFSNDKENLNRATVKSSYFDENGVLVEWPYGFFNYDN